MSAAGADAVSAHRSVEAAVAEPITRPVDAQLVGHAMATAAFESTDSDSRSSTCGGARRGVNRCHR
jgi:hypothetical protein